MQLTETFLSLKNVRTARAALQEKGCLVFEAAYSRVVCNEIIRWMDSERHQGRTEVNYGGSELRLWESQVRHDALADFTERSDMFISCLTGVDTEAFTLLAIRNRALDSRDTSLQLGRWHIDSFRKQYKTFLFLGDVTESTGPFEFVPGTHLPAFKAKMALSGRYFKVADFLRHTRSYARIEDKYVDRLFSQGYIRNPVVCPAGTVMVVDTSAIHRARPCLAGARYALTAYYR